MSWLDYIREFDLSAAPLHLWLSALSVAFSAFGVASWVWARISGGKLKDGERNPKSSATKREGKTVELSIKTMDAFEIDRMLRASKPSVTPHGQGSGRSVPPPREGDYITLEEYGAERVLAASLARPYRRRTPANIINSTYRYR